MKLNLQALQGLSLLLATHLLDRSCLVFLIIIKNGGGSTFIRTQQPCDSKRLAIVLGCDIQVLFCFT